jgi:hypothetical protein
VPDDQFQLDAERYAELVTLVTLVTVLLGQFVAFESRLGRQYRPAIALVVGKCRAAVAVIVRGFWPAIAFRQLRLLRQRGFVFPEWIPVRRINCGWWVQLRRFRAAATAAAARLAHASVRRRFAGQHAIVVRLTVRRGVGRGYARSAGRFDTQWRLNWTRRLERFGGPTGVHQCGIRWSARFVWPTRVHECRVRSTTRVGGHGRPARLGRG